ncbi:MAG TPA: hypothetical protein VG900_09110 [Hyphomicrobiaceae bacterium]|nr:hypothetical protein [Hyphomicrobiaceae bacterium]
MKRIIFRIGTGLMVVCALLALFNLFDSSPRAARNAVELLAMGAGLYVAAVCAGWLAARMLAGGSRDPGSSAR